MQLSFNVLNSYSWHIPLTYVAQKNKKSVQVWMNMESGKNLILFIFFVIVDSKMLFVCMEVKQNQTHSCPFQVIASLSCFKDRDNNFLNIFIFLASLNWSRTSGWIKANVDQIGYYRVNYGMENWRALCQQLNSDHRVSVNSLLKRTAKLTTAVIT